MIQAVSSADTERFRAVIARRLGLHFDDAKLGMLADVLRRRVGAARHSAGAYLAGMEAESWHHEIGALAQELTVPETYFFRNPDQFRAFAEIALPDRSSVQNGGRHLRILSAGCATGEESYSLGILVRDALDPSWDVSILGVDINPAALHRATHGRYSAWALRETKREVQQRWFKADGREFVLDQTLRSLVSFELRNLAQDDAQLWQPDGYDIVFFRNVLMYFTQAQGQAVIARIARALKPGGYLFLGHAETLRGLSGDFHLQHTHETFYYQRKDHRAPSAVLPTSGASWRRLDPSSLDAADGTDSWIETIRRATARIETLTDSARPSAALAAATPRAARATWDLALALDLLREERFTEASELVRRLPPESGRDPGVLLLNAALVTHGGQFAEAEHACRRLLDVDEMSAGAHYLLALCREGARDRLGAAYHDQVAVYLDPVFAMPRLHLGLLARRAGDRAGAQRALEEALPLLQREDASRLLLFGGGFSREALIALCRTELAGCGGSR
ncbi:MAG TPA: protein-glutamate O-methyltransferase CheR [Vicinamibacterales bacterium]|nr:protein-glutamate O-methyltransferase CheR [Vicinamibacterales bacterium]